MIAINRKPMEMNTFPDGTMLTHIPLPENKEVTIDWRYESDKETLALIYAVNHLKAHGYKDISLFMPYIPNARQDRVKTDDDVFTLKYFAGIINSLSLKAVTALDPHSNVSEALFDRLTVMKPDGLIHRVIARITEIEGEAPSMFYPDEGAGKRYGGMIPLPYSFGIKKRDWKTGKILGLDAAGDTESIEGKSILIVDDICSRGGTFYFSAKKLKELGAANVYLYVSHMEKTVFEGEVLTSGLIERVFTTDSIFRCEHEKIEVLAL